MSKSFRLRILRVIPSFHSCRCKDDATAVPTACPIILPAAANRVRTPRENLWQDDVQWRVFTRVEASPRLKIDAEDGKGELFPPLRLQRRPRRTAKRKMMVAGKVRSGLPGGAGRISTTSTAETRWFTSEDEGIEHEEDEDEEDKEYEEDYEYEEMDGRSLSVDYSSSAASEFTSSLRWFCESPGRWPCPSTDAEGRRSSSASSLLQRFMQMGPSCTGGAAEGKVAESFAMVKRSEDPYLDFRRSMVEMVVEKGIYEEGDLEELLRCLLSLNSRHHHATIVRAFSDVCAALFDPSSRSSCVSVSTTPPPPPFTPV